MTAADNTQLDAEHRRLRRLTRGNGAGLPGRHAYRCILPGHSHHAFGHVKARERVGRNRYKGTARLGNQRACHNTYWTFWRRDLDGLADSEHWL